MFGVATSVSEPSVDPEPAPLELAVPDGLVVGAVEPVVAVVVVPLVPGVSVLVEAVVVIPLAPTIAPPTPAPIVSAPIVCSPIDEGTPIALTVPRPGVGSDAASSPHAESSVGTNSVTLHESKVNDGIARCFVAGMTLGGA